MSHLASPSLQPHLLRILIREEFYFIFPGLLVGIENQINFKIHQRCFVVSRKRKPLAVSKTQTMRGRKRRKLEVPQRNAWKVDSVPTAQIKRPLQKSK